MPALFDFATDLNSTTNNALQVVCTWPLSGQYGPGSRALYASTASSFQVQMANVSDTMR
jgi:hypothetical protein